MTRTLLPTLFAVLSSAAHAQTGMSWSSATSGSIGQHTVTITDISGIVSSANLSGAAFAAAPLSTSQSSLTYEANRSWTANFSPALPGLLWYGAFIRGAGANTTGSPVDYTFSHPLTILSGFSQGTVNGATLTLPGTGFHDGILKFGGDITTLTCTTTATVNGNQIFTLGQLDQPFGANYCSPAVTNTTGSPAHIWATGSDFAADNFAWVHVESMPPNAFAFFLTSRSRGFAAMPGASVGNLCLGGSIGRLIGPGQIQNSGASGEISLELDLTQLPTPTGFVQVAAGEQWNFQAWYRDLVGGTPRSNFSDGLTVLFR